LIIYLKWNNKDIKKIKKNKNKYINKKILLNKNNFLIIKSINKNLGILMIVSMDESLIHNYKLSNMKIKINLMINLLMKIINISNKNLIHIHNNNYQLSKKIIHQSTNKQFNNHT
jgi:hypothetical protein